MMKFFDLAALGVPNSSKHQTLYVTTLVIIINAVLVYGGVLLELTGVVCAGVVMVVNLIISGTLLARIINGWLANRRDTTAALLVNDAPPDEFVAVGNLKNSLQSWTIVTLWSLFNCLSAAYFDSTGVLVALTLVPMFVIVMALLLSID